MVGFTQSGIDIQQPEPYQALRSALERVLAPERVEAFLRQVKRKSLRIRELEAILAAGILERVDRGWSGAAARQLYGSLPVSDQAQMREFYLLEVEKIASPLRAKYHGEFETF